MPFRSSAPAIASALALLLCACGRNDAESPAPVADVAPETVAAAPAETDTAERQPLKARAAWKPTPLLVPAEARDALLMQATEAERQGLLYGNEPLGALDLYAALADADPPMPEARIGRDRIIGLLQERFEAERVAGNLEAAEEIDAVLAVVSPAEAAGRGEALAAARVAATATTLGDSRREAGQWLAPRGGSAVAAYREALAAVPGFAPASAGLEGIEKALLDRATASAAKGEFDAAEADLRRAARVGLDPDAVQDGRAALAQSRSAAADVAVDEANEAIDRLDLPRAATRLADAQQIDPQAPGLDELSSRLALARRYGHFRPGQRFADALGGGIDGPVMVVAPHGDFTMGAGEDESGARDNERPAHGVRFERGFALAVRETSVAEFARFVAATGYRTVAERRGRSTVYDERGGAMVELRGAHWRRGYQGRTPAAPDDPVIHIAFDDAVAYAEWLSVRTGLRYRLPSEAEFEYALRGGRATPWAWGDRAPTRAVANLTGDGDQSPQGRRWGRAIRGWSDGHWGLAPVGTYAPEGFGTHDLIGNVSEWVEDCWHDSYRRAPGDGRAWVNPGCEERVVRGGSWASTLEQSRSAFRLQVPAALTSARIGFRVARDL
ncbi:SUMF1/EgtB/PvdO family nonheme iron enzyme [Silanimonas sp.]|uniref:SUMF1/EgtB/PvdO family nonheme iron enzyme n=1 Tax=Silanimonas sp. TaxID=1929290 RepID=UPI0037CB77DD